MDRHKDALELAKKIQRTRTWCFVENTHGGIGGMPIEATDSHKQLADALLDYAKQLETAEDDRRILSRKRVEGNEQLERIFERVVGTIADRTYHRQCTYQEYHALKARVAELEAAILQAHPKGMDDNADPLEVLRTLSREWQEEIMRGPIQTIVFQDGDKERTIIWEDGDDGAGIPSGYEVDESAPTYTELEAEVAQATSIGTQYERFEDAGNGDTRCKWCSAYIGHDKGCPGDMFSTPKEALRFAVSAHDRLAYQLARKDKGLSRLILAVDKLNQTRTDRSPLEMITAWNAVWSAIDIAQKTLD